MVNIRSLFSPGSNEPCFPRTAPQQAYMHSRMRKRTESLLQVLNRAKPETEKKKITASGRTFTRK